MANKKAKAALPDYLVSPGEIIEEFLDHLGMSQAELASRTGLAKKTINEIIKGKAPVTMDTAIKLERVLSRPAHFWTKLESQYQEDKLRLSEKERLQENLSWLSNFPVQQMMKLGWLPQSKDKVEQLEELLRFFGIASPAQFDDVWERCNVAFRQSDHGRKSKEAICAWLRKGYIEAQKIPKNEYDPSKFKQALAEIRELTLEERPDRFIAKLTELCASAGVLAVFVQELPGTSISGATRWEGNNPIIQLSLRYKSNDQLWFSFFHEAGHILKHGRRDFFLEIEKPKDDKEIEADNFARDQLIPLHTYRKFVQSRHYTQDRIRTFARSVRIAPGIVVGRMQHERLIPFDTGNRLKVFYSWRAPT